MKRMVNVLFAGVLAMTVLSCGEEKKGYTLNGEISDVKDGMVYLKKYQDKSFIAVDSAVITLLTVLSNLKVFVLSHWLMG